MSCLLFMRINLRVERGRRGEKPMATPTGNSGGKGLLEVVQGGSQPDSERVQLETLSSHLPPRSTSGAAECVEIEKMVFLLKIVSDIKLM